MFDVTKLKNEFTSTHNGSTGRAGGTNRKGGGAPAGAAKARKGSARQSGIDTPLFGRKGGRGRPNTKTLPGISGVRKAAVGGFPNLRGASKGRKGK